MKDDTRSVLVVKQPWADKIVKGEKTWELRGRRTNKRGRVAIAVSGQGGLIIGGATLVDCHGPVKKDEMATALDKHCVPAASRLGRYDKTYAWEFKDACKLEAPITYTHRHGAVIWAKLPHPVRV